MGKAFFSYNTATNEIPRAVYKENMQTLDCHELCSLVRDKIIISSPSRPNPQVACRIMIGVVLSHLFCIPLWHTAFQACQELHPQADWESSSCCHPDPAQVTSTPAHHCFEGTYYMINSLSPTSSQASLLPLSPQKALPSHPHLWRAEAFNQPLEMVSGQLGINLLVQGAVVSMRSPPWLGVFKELLQQL